MISNSLKENINIIKEKFNFTNDLVFYDFITESDIKLTMAYIDGIIDTEKMYNNIVKQLVYRLKNKEDILSKVIVSGGKISDDLEEIVDDITSGSVAIFLEGNNKAYLFSLSSIEKRSVGEAGNERVVRGPKEGFIENIDTNKVLIRKLLRTNNLVFEDFIIGNEIKTRVSICYMKNKAEESLVEELRSRISKIDIEGFFYVSDIENKIENRKRSLLSTVGNTEKPDIAASKIFEGKIAILCDGASDVLLVPKLFIENLESEEDFYLKKQFAIFLRILRTIALITAITLPGFLVALKTFHQEMIPNLLLISMVINIDMVPFTPIMEGFLMLMFLEFIKEASVRIPTNIGSTATVVSGLVLGQTAVQAGIVGPIMVIVIGASGISEFMVPKFRESIALYRILMLILGGLLGILGIAVGFLMIIVHLISLKSIGVPFMYPMAPFDKEKFKDFVFIRSPKSKI